jgi:hypothetical protein
MRKGKFKCKEKFKGKGKFKEKGTTLLRYRDFALRGCQAS